VFDPVAELVAGVKELGAEDRAGWAAAAQNDRVAELVGVAEALQVELVRAVAGWHASSAWAADGAVTAVSWLRSRTGLAKGEATALVQVAELCTAHPRVARAVYAGDLGIAQAKVLVRARRHRISAFEGCVAGFVQLAAEVDLDDFAQVIAQWVELVDDRPPPEESRRRFGSRATIGGSAHTELYGPDEDAAVIRAAIEALDRPDTPNGAEPPRTREQRHYDIVIDIFRRVLTDELGDDLMSPGGADVLLDADTAAALLADPDEPGRIHLDPIIELFDPAPEPGLAERILARRCHHPDGTRARRTFAAALLCTGWIRRLLVDPATGAPIDLGRSQRRFTPRQRRALIARDGGCVFPGCDRPPRWCDAHHLRPWHDDGPTDLDNGCLLCRRHHRLLHTTRWKLEREPITGVITATAPDGRTFTRQPTHHR